MRHSAIILSLCALLFEAMSFVALLRDQALTMLSMHVLCALALGCAATSGQPLQQRRKAGSIAAWALFVPVFAPLGLCLIVLPALRRLRAHEPDAVLEIQRARPKLTAARAPQTLSLRDMLHEMAHDPTQRTAALMSLRHTELSRAAPLLRTALLDANEDLRLLAYALLERREKLLRARIEATKREPQTHVVLAQLCSDHWLLVQAKFVSGDALTEALAAALDCGERALQLQNDGALSVLLARICLRADKPDRALDHLDQAQQQGIARSVLAPLFAHAAFLLGSYRVIGSLLRVSSAARLARPEQQGARQHWELT